MAYPSQFSDLYNAVISQVRLDDSDDLQRAKDWVNAAYFDVCVDTEATQEVADITLTAGDWLYTMDSAVTRMKTLWITAVDGEQTGPLKQVSPQEIIRLQQSTDTATDGGTPTLYALVGLDQLALFPTPDEAATLSMFYVEQPAALSANTDVPVLPEPYATECIVNGACFKACLFLGNPDAPTYKQLFEEARNRLRSHLRRAAGSSSLQFELPYGRPVSSDPSVDRR